MHKVGRQDIRNEPRDRLGMEDDLGAEGSRQQPISQSEIGVQLKASICRLWSIFIGGALSEDALSSTISICADFKDDRWRQAGSRLLSKMYSALSEEAPLCSFKMSSCVRLVSNERSVLLPHKLYSRFSLLAGSFKFDYPTLLVPFHRTGLPKSIYRLD